MSEMGVRRAKAVLSSGCKPHPATLQPEAIGSRGTRNGFGPPDRVVGS
jgi:hypothetical protein